MDAAPHTGGFSDKYEQIDTMKIKFEDILAQFNAKKQEILQIGQE